MCRTRLRRLDLPAWVIGRSRVRFPGLADLLSWQRGGYGKERLASHSSCSDLLGKLPLPLAFFQGPLLLLPLSFLLLPLLTLRLMFQLFLFMFTTFSFLSKEKGLLLTSFSMSKNITERDRVLFVNILRKSDPASCGRRGRSQGRGLDF